MTQCIEKGGAGAWGKRRLLYAGRWGRGVGTRPGIS